MKTVSAVSHLVTLNCSYLVSHNKVSKTYVAKTTADQMWEISIDSSSSAYSANMVNESHGLLFFLLSYQIT